MNALKAMMLKNHVEVRKPELDDPGCEKVSIKNNPHNKVVRKKWGSELIISKQPYAFKVMTLEPGTTCSNHFHIEKQETFLLISGTLVIELTNLNTGLTETIALTEPYSSVTLYPLVPHRFYTPNGQMEPTVFVEASTTDYMDDNYRFTESSDQAFNNR